MREETRRVSRRVDSILAGPNGGAEKGRHVLLVDAALAGRSEASDKRKRLTSEDPERTCIRAH